MANAGEIKNRIKSIQDIRKITNAMYLISTTKLRRAKLELDKTRPYFLTLKEEIGDIFFDVPGVRSKYFWSEERPIPNRRRVKRSACLVITSDKGLAGAYNHNVLKLAMDYMEAQDYMPQAEKAMLFVVGEYGRQFFRQKKIPVAKSFLYTAQNPSINRAREITNVITSLYNRGDIDEVHMIYTDMQNGVTTEVREQKLLPLDKDDFQQTSVKNTNYTEEDFVPSVKQILDNLVPSYLTGFIFSALVDSFCSEQNARMLAMDSAGRNAEEMLHELSMEYNRVRQAAITQEITEVAAGAKGQKRAEIARQKEA